MSTSERSSRSKKFISACAGLTHGIDKYHETIIAGADYGSWQKHPKDCPIYYLRREEFVFLREREIAHFTPDANDYLRPPTADIGDRTAAGTWARAKAREFAEEDEEVTTAIRIANEEGQKVDQESTSTRFNEANALMLTEEDLTPRKNDQRDGSIPSPTPEVKPESEDFFVPSNEPPITIGPQPAAGPSKEPLKRRVSFNFGTIPDPRAGLEPRNEGYWGPSFGRQQQGFSPETPLAGRFQGPGHTLGKNSESDSDRKGTFPRLPSRQPSVPPAPTKPSRQQSGPPNGRPGGPPPPNQPPPPFNINPGPPAPNQGAGGGGGGPPGLGPVPVQQAAPQFLGQFRIENPKLQKINDFEGKRGRDAREWVRLATMELRSYNREAAKGRALSGTAYPLDITDQESVEWALRHITGKGHDWAAVYINHIEDPYWPNAPELLDWNLFVEALLRQFASADPQREAEEKLLGFRQGSLAIALHAAEFRETAEETSFGDSAKLAQFRFSLRSNLQSAIALQPNQPTGYSEFVDWVIRMGESMEKHTPSYSNQGRGFNGNRGRGFNRPDRSNWRQPNATTGQGNQSAHFGQSGPKPSDAQIQQRRDAGTCFNCGLGGHLARACPTRNQTRPNTSGGNRPNNRNQGSGRFQKGNAAVMAEQSNEQGMEDDSYDLPDSHTLRGLIVGESMEENRQNSQDFHRRASSLPRGQEEGRWGRQRN